MEITNRTLHPAAIINLNNMRIENSTKNLSSTKRRPTLIKRYKRLSFVFEKVQHVRPILRTPVARAARNISRKARQIQFTKSIIIDITPLPDKPLGRIRMPQEENEENSEDEDDKENSCNLSSLLTMRSVVKSASLTSVLGKRKLPKSLSPIAFNFDIESSMSERIKIKEGCSIAVESAPINVSNLWSVEESEIYELAMERAKNKVSVKTELWSQIFAPKSKSEIFNNTIRIYTWLGEWVTRLSSCKLEGVSVKRKQKSTMYEDDDDFECTDRELPNPLIIAGPCGCGKTSAVYCAAEELQIRLIEFSPSERRNGVSLEKKLSGAIDSHYVQSSSAKRGQSDIRQMFSPKHVNESQSNRKSVSPVYNYSVVLIDDCDIIYSNDDNFWSSLKSICEESKIPIVLTCTNYNFVKKMLNTGSIFKTNESVHFVSPITSRFSRHLRAWLVGYTQKLVSPKWLWKLVEDYHNDVRAVLNAIQFQMVNRKLDNTTLPNTDCQLLLKSHAKRIAALSELDAAYGKKPDESVTWRARKIADLDYRSDNKRAYQPLQREYLTFLDWHQLSDALKRFFLPNQFSSLFKNSWNTNSQPPLLPLRDAWMRSWPRFSYSWQSVGTDYMPCLWAIDEKFHLDVRRRLALNPANSFASNSFCGVSFSTLSGTTSRTRSRNGRNCHRVQHPFDEINAATVQAIDRNERLRLSISKYAFSKVFQQNY